MMRRHKIKTVAEASLVTNEDEARAVNNQVVFQKGLKTSTTSSLQEHFNNHFGKVASHNFILYTLECLMSIPIAQRRDRDAGLSKTICWLAGVYSAHAHAAWPDFDPH